MMDLSKFPMDKQSCALIYESFNYNNFEVQMRWSTAVPDAVYRLKEIRLPDFDLVGIESWHVAQVRQQVKAAIDPSLSDVPRRYVGRASCEVDI